MDIKDLSKKIQDATSTSFSPTDDQKKAKSRFWTTLSGEGAPTPLPHPDLAQALRYGGDKQISKWWGLSGFSEWFWNRNEFNEKLEYIGLLALEELEATLKSKLVTSAQKIPAIKLALEVSNKLGKGGAETVDLPERLANMSRKELEAFIESRSSLLDRTEGRNSLTESPTSDTLPKLQ